MARRGSKTADDLRKLKAATLAGEHGGLIALRGSLDGKRGRADGHWYWRDEYLAADPSWWYRAGYVETAETVENLNLVVNGVNLRWYGPGVIWRFDPSLVLAPGGIGVFVPLWQSQPTFCSCGERLFLIAEGRVRCERCRLGVAGPVLLWSATLSRVAHEPDDWSEIFPPSTDLDQEPIRPPEPLAAPPPTADEVDDWVWRQVAHLYDW